MDDNYQTYVNRVARMTLPESYTSQLDYIQESPKFKPDSTGNRKPVPFPGFTVITPPAGEASDNRDFYKNLQQCQHQLGEVLDQHFFVPIPADSLHLTLADLIWDGAYKEASKNLDFEAKLCNAIAQSFESFQSTPITHSIRWQVLGLMVMPRAMGVCLVPRDEDSYQQILQFRRAIYQNSDLMGLGIEQQYHLTAHITLGYFGEIPADLDRQQFCQVLCDLNQQWLDSPQELWINQAELRKFDDMTEYYRKPDWPILKFKHN